ncbi:MAG: hypothetical protein P1U58_06790 [Verrucomicrobiales bacterium]|nr:hypothetical protein [Verrucomicrobiales bacterium]
MSDPIANRTLELACTVGAADDAIEAIEDGADVNYQGGAPLFLAIMNRNRGLIHLLLDHGAVADSFIAKKKLALVNDRDDLIEELIACAPHNPRDVKPDQIAEIDTAIRNEGVGYLVAEIDWDKATRFRDSLDAIGAGGSHRCVAELLQWVRSENGADRDALGNFLVSHENTITEYRERYLTTGEDLIALANEYVTEADGNDEG